MLRWLSDLAREEDGLEMVEWALVAALVTSVTVGTVAIIGAQLNLAFVFLLARVQAG